MQPMNYITRKGKFDAGHRVMHERFKCFNVHGHEYHYEMTFASRDFTALGYAIDFKELKRVGCQWVDDTFDHGFIANPADKVMISACRELQSKLYIMSLHDEKGFCNPSAENIAKEMFFGISVLLNQPFAKTEDYFLRLVRIKLHETINSYVECTGLTPTEWDQLLNSILYKNLCEYRQQKGVVEYDERLTSKG